MRKVRQGDKSDLINAGGTAPGATVAFPGAANQWSSSNLAARNNYPTGSPNIDPIGAWKMMHYGLADEAPDARRNVPIHPGLRPGLYRTASDANPVAPRGTWARTDAVANDGRPLSPDGRHRGESPEVPKLTRGGYRP